MKKNSCLAIVFAMMNLLGYSQESKPKYVFIELNHYSDTLKKLGHDILYGETDSIRISCKEKFNEAMEKALNYEASFLYPFDSVKNVSILTAPDNSFRILTWYLPTVSGSSNSFYGYIQTYNKRKNTSKLFPLIDKSDTITNPQIRKLNTDCWYGQVYYKMIPCKKGGRKFYTMLGCRWMDKTKTQKIIDVVSVSGDKITFGLPIFKQKKPLSRMLFTYSAQVVMSLKYNESNKIITYDHLQPSDPNMVGQYEFYGPDGSYDELIFKKGNWILKADVDVRNPKDKTSTKPRTPTEGNNGR